MKKILIIDYDQNSLASLQAIFSAQGYQVVTAADGQTGWDKYNKESPDLVLMEAMLPKVHGFELCQRITSERNSQATVFIMTGVYKDRVYRTEALRTYGASEYFEKPLKMAELLASVEAVLGKPEPRPAPQPQAATPDPTAAAAATAHGVVRPEPAPVGTRKPKARSDDSIFALPDDLDRLSREIPKAHKPMAPRPDPAAEHRFDAIAEQLLKTVIVESSAPKTVEPKPGSGNGNGNGNGGGAEIDKFLKSALAGFDLNKEKVKVARPAPQPEIPVKDKPLPPPVRPAPPEFKPTPPAPHKPEKPFNEPPTADMKNTLTPGDPGSDVSPFFAPEAPKPARPVERAEKRAAPAPVHHEAPRYEPVRPEPDRRETERPQPRPAETRAEETRVLAASAIFEEAAEPSEKKGFPTFLAVVLGIVAIAAVGFILLKPKHPAPVVPPPQEPAQTAANTVQKPVEEAPAPVIKPAPAKQKAQPQARPADQGGASAILPTQAPAPSLPLPGNRVESGSGAGKAPAGQDAPAGGPAPVKTEETAQPAAKTVAEPPQSLNNETTAAAEPSTTAAAPAPAPVHEGDLVELGSVTELPKLLKKVEPAYPAAAQRVGREGNITVNALIDEKGNVIDTGILKGIQDDKGLGRAAETALRKWKFQPALRNGVAVKVWKPFVIAFKADVNPAK